MQTAELEKNLQNRVSAETEEESAKESTEETTESKRSSGRGETKESESSEGSETTEATGSTEGSETSEASEPTEGSETNKATGSSERSETTKPSESAATEAPAKTAGSRADSLYYGALQVIGANLCDSEGNPVQLRGVSTHGLSWFPDYVNEALFQELHEQWNVNVVRLAMYTAEYGGYCTGGDREQLKQLVKNGVEYASGRQPQENQSRNGSGQNQQPQSNQGQTGATAAAPEDLNVTLQPVNSWESDGKHFYQYEMTVENVSDRTIDGWKADIFFNESFELSDSWNGVYTVDGNILHVSSMDYNGRLESGASAENIGFIVSGFSGLLP